MSNSMRPLFTMPQNVQKTKVQHVEQMGQVSDEKIQHHEPESLEWKQTERSLVRKLDLTLLPTVWLMYLFNYLDRNNIAQAQLSSFESDLKLVGSDLNVAISILNVGYMLAQLPSNMLIQRLRPSIYIPGCVMVWSCISAATSGVKGYSGLVAVRFFLGIVEAPFFPGAFYLLTCWYTRAELALRTAVLYSSLVLATAFSGLIAAGIFAGLEGSRGLAGWQWLFIIEGAASFFFAMIAMMLLPDYVDSKTGSAKWLFTRPELEVAAQRIEADRVSLPEASRSVSYGVLIALKDVKTWIFVLILCSNHSAYGYNNFFPTIVQGFDLGSNTLTLVLTAPPYLVAAALSLLVAYSSDRTNDRGYHIAGSMTTAIVGFVISVATLNPPTRYAASFIYATGTFAANSAVYSWAASVLNETPEKRAAATAIINLLAQLGNIWSPYFFRSEDKPRYTLAMILMMVFSALSVIGAMSMKLILKRENKKLLQNASETGLEVTLHSL